MIDRRVAVPGGEVWVRVHGQARKPPLVVLHGGPGCPSDYLFPLAALAVDRSVIFYDQLGCGRSDRGAEADYRRERYVDELGVVLDALGCERVVVFGHSWGSMLAVDAGLRWPDRFERMILASPCLSMTRTRADMARLRAQLPEPVRATLDRLEARGQTHSPAYQVAALVFYQRHLCRLSPWPQALRVATENWGTQVYRSMWGPAEFMPTGSLRDYEREQELTTLAMPLLFTCGRYDEVTPEATAAYCARARAGQLEVFETSAHVPHLEQPDEFLATVRQFIEAGD